MANAIKNNQNNALIGKTELFATNLVDDSDIKTISNVLRSPLKNTPTNAINIAALPKMVKIKNFMAEYSRLPLPHTLMSIYIGISSNSQKRKKSRRSSDVNTPMTAVCNINNQTKYSLTLS